MKSSFFWSSAPKIFTLDEEFHSKTNSVEERRDFFAFQENHALAHGHVWSFLANFKNHSLGTVPNDPYIRDSEMSPLRLRGKAEFHNPDGRLVV